MLSILLLWALRWLFKHTRLQMPLFSPKVASNAQLVEPEAEAIPIEDEGDDKDNLSESNIQQKKQVHPFLLYDFRTLIITGRLHTQRLRHSCPISTSFNSASCSSRQVLLSTAHVHPAIYWIPPNTNALNVSTHQLSTRFALCTSINHNHSITFSDGLAPTLLRQHFTTLAW